jgi:hypothetical protein
VAVLVEENVLGFDVSVDDFLAVQVWKAEEDLDDVESRYLLVDASVFFDQAEQLAPCAVFHHEDEVLLWLEGEFHINHKRMIRAFHDVPFVHDDSLFLVFYNHFLVNHFHRVKAPVLLEPTQEHFWKPARANQLENFKRLQTDLLFLVDAVVDSTAGLQVERLAVEEFAINAAGH